MDDRHERTGSVKFADQSDEGKEVRKNIIKYLSIALRNAYVNLSD